MNKKESRRSKFFFVVLMTLLTHNYLLSQSIGVGGGVSLSHLSMNDTREGYQSVRGLSAQTFYELDLTQSCGFRFGLSYHSKGNRYESESTQEYQINNQAVSLSSLISVKTRLNYIDFKPLFVYRKSINQQSSIYGCFGPYIGLGISGHRSHTQRYTSSPQGFIPEVNITDTEGISFGSSGSGFDYLDFGFSSIVGYTYLSFYTELSYEFGLNNIDSFNNSDSRIMNRLFSLKVGYLIRFNKDK